MIRRRQLMFRIVLLLILGALLNVVVAWGFSLLVNPFGLPDDQLGSHVRVHGDAMRWLRVRSHIGASWYSAGFREAGEFERDYGDDPQSHHPWWWDEGLPPARPDSNFHPQAQARGWPLRCMWYAIEYRDHVGGRGRMGAEGGWETPLSVWLDPMVFSTYDQPRVLPLRIIWLHFLANTVFFAMVLWMVVALPRMYRRKSRMKRKLCPACAYPIGMSPLCTECGQQLPSRQQS